MLAIFDPLRDITIVSVAFRMLLAFICGAIIGGERAYKNRPAGLRTHILVCVGGAVASLVGIFLFVDQKLPADPSRIGAQVITGLGFLGGGTIIVTQDNTVKGLTTAAGLWASGILGLAVGAGFYEGGLVCLLIIIVTETLFSKLSARLRRTTEFQIIIHYSDKKALDNVIRYLKDQRITITNLRITNYKEGQRKLYSALFHTRCNKALDFEYFTENIRDNFAIEDVEVIQ